MKKESERYIRRWIIVLSFSIIAGIVGGLGALAFRGTIILAQRFFFGFLLPKVSLNVNGLNLGYILLPALGGLLVAPLIKKAPEIKGNGVPEIIEAVIFKGGMIKRELTFLKIVATSITIGSGGSAGREGPIGFIGASLASTLAQAFKLSKEMRKLLTTCGLAAGIAGIFNTPLAGAMFALEVIYNGAFSINIVPILLSAIVGNSVTLFVLGDAFELSIPPNLSINHRELVLFFLMGLFFGVLAAFLVKSFYMLIDKFENLNLPFLLKPALGGLFVGFIGMFFPHYGIFGIGYEGMRLAINGLLPLKLLILLGIAKILATSLTLSSGHSGGIFAPSLYIGTMIGAAFGVFFKILFPEFVSSEAVYALSGMAALFSGVTQAPITQILMIAELTRSYAILPAVMSSSVISFLVARYFLKGSSVYTLKLERKGLRVKAGRPAILSTITVEEIMTKNPVFLNISDTISDVEHLIAKTGHDYYPVVDEELRVVGIIGIRDLIKCSPDAKLLPIREFLDNNTFVTIYPSETAQDALDKMIKCNLNLIPVINKEDKRLIGVVTKSDIYKAYYLSVEREYIE
jgi:CIC family chloride channel protein